MNNPNKLRFRDVYEKMKAEKKEIKESQAQEIGDSYKKLSKYYGVDLNDLVYGPEGFMKTKYPEGFDVAADIIFLEDKWNEFEDWLKETHGIDFEAIRATKKTLDLDEEAGGKSLGMSVEDIAEKHGVAVGDIEKQIKIGVEIEQEHTSDVEEAKKIAMDHLVEFPDYYDRLVKMEKDAKNDVSDLDEDKAVSNVIKYRDSTIEIITDYEDDKVSAVRTIIKTPGLKDRYDSYPLDDFKEYTLRKIKNNALAQAKIYIDDLTYDDYEPQLTTDPMAAGQWYESKDKRSEHQLTEDLVEPKPDESISDYVSRFMETKLAQKEFPNEKQRLAVAYSKFMSKKEALTEEVLDTSKLNFHNLLGKITLEYPSIVVINRFGEENTVGCKLDVDVTEDDVINFICNENILDKEILTNEEAQPFIDQVAADPKMFKAELSDVHYEKAKEKAQREILGDYAEGFEPETFDDDEPIFEALKTSDTVVGVTVSMIGYDYDLRKDKGYAYATLSRKDRSDEPIWIILNYSELRDNAVYEWGEDGESTYVPYGEQSVLLDDGKGTVEQVTISEIEPDDFYYELQDETVIRRDDAMEILEVTDEEMKKIEALAGKLGDKYLRPIVEELLKDHDEYYPSRDE